MSDGANAPIIIKRKKSGGGDGHHGGAWKVAYADFVTAMMAFFMLMWLLNATTEAQRKGLADYFSPTIPIAKISGGGSGALSGNNLTTEQTMATLGQGASPYKRSESNDSAAEQAASVATLREVQHALLGKGGESLVAEKALQHVISRITDEGLVIELFDVGDIHLFKPGTSEPTEIANELAAMLVRGFEIVENDVAVATHVRSWPRPLAQERAWPLTMERADRFRRMLVAKGLKKDRIARATGHADNKIVAPDPMSTRNNRIEVTLLRSWQ